MVKTKETGTSELVEHGREYFNKDPEVLAILRIGTEGTRPEDRYWAEIKNQTIVNIKNNTKSVVSKKNLLNGTIDHLLDVMVEKVQKNIDYQESKLTSKKSSYDGLVNNNTVPAAMATAFNSALSRYHELKTNPNKTKLLIEKKLQRSGLDENVMDNIGLVTLYQDGIKQYSANIVDIIIGVDSSGGKLV